MATFGDTNIEAGWNAPGQNGLQVCGTFTPGSDGMATAISGYVRGTGSAGVVPYRLVVYAYTAGVPAAFVGATADQTLAAGAAAAWVSPAASFAVTAGTLYVIGVHTGVNSGDAALEYAYNATGGAFNIEYITDTFVPATPTSPFPASPSTINWESSFYVTFTPAAGGPVNTAAPVVTFSGTDPTQDSPLSCTAGAWNDGGSAITGYNWQALRDGYEDGVFAVIPGFGGSNVPAAPFLYTPTIADVGCDVEYQVQAINANGTSAWVTSNVVGPVVLSSDSGDLVFPEYCVATDAGVGNATATDRARGAVANTDRSYGDVQISDL